MSNWACPLVHLLLAELPNLSPLCCLLLTTGDRQAFFRSLSSPPLLVAVVPAVPASPVGTPVPLRSSFLAFLPLLLERWIRRPWITIGLLAAFLLELALPL